MRLVWLLVATAVPLSASVRASRAQGSASAAILANVHQVKHKPPKGPHAVSAAQSQTLSFTTDGGAAGASRALLRTPAGDPIAVALEGTTALRVSLRASDPENAGGSPSIHCRAWMGDETPPNASLQSFESRCGELVLRWPDSSDWPALLFITETVRPHAAHPGRFVAQLTIVAEY